MKTGLNPSVINILFPLLGFFTDAEFQNFFQMKQRIRQSFSSLVSPREEG